MNITTYPENDIEAEENELDTRVAGKCTTSQSKSSSITITPSTAKASAEATTKPHCVKLTRNFTNLLTITNLKQ